MTCNCNKYVSILMNYGESEDESEQRKANNWRNDVYTSSNFCVLPNKKFYLDTLIDVSQVN